MSIFKKLRPKQKKAVETVDKIVIFDDETLEIDVLKEVISDAFTVVTNLFLIDDDFASAILKIASVAAKYANAGESFKIAFDQFKDLDPAEAAEVTEHVVTVFDIEDDVKEKEIEDVIRIPAMGFAAIKSAEAVVKDLVAVIEDETLNGWDKASALADMAPVVVAELKYVADFVTGSLKEIRDLSA